MPEPAGAAEAEAPRTRGRAIRQLLPALPLVLGLGLVAAAILWTAGIDTWLG